jgi:putative transposase
MPRANRHFVPGRIWHITHRCHERAFLLKFVRDRRRYLHWLFEARKRFGLCILDYVVTSNHIHLLVKDRGEGEIARSMQLVAGRTGQEFNRRKLRQGAFWEDRYHATAVDRDEHLQRCLVYIDLNMVRAGVVTHPREWRHGGYQEIHQPPERYSLIDLPELVESCGLSSLAKLQQSHAMWVDEALARNEHERDGRWTEALAVGSENFVIDTRRELGMRGIDRRVEPDHGVYVLRDAARDGAYNAEFRSESRR